MHPYLFIGLRVGPRALADLVRRIPQDKWDTPTHEGRFTPREVIAHMADWEPIFQQRIQQTLDQPGSTVVGIDEIARAEEMKYQDWDMEKSIEKFATEREKTVNMLQALTKDQFAISGVHNEKGVLTVDDHANMLLGHDLYHIEQLLDCMN